ncbi:hemolymph juvenile hormone binding protein (JHBP) [Popillia japonica]|uniref:Hemolymph juvenile hormone binding protein (JHBP) n=1 Tax=Popillia japonica TaxID=7064 RepID=A0AAW1N093_POPJA
MSKLISYVMFLFVCLNAGLSDGVKLPPNIGRCNLKDPNLNECIGKNIEDAVRKFKDGAPQIGIPPFEPLKISKMVIGEGTGPVNVQQNFENIELSGLTDSKVLKEIVDMEKDKHYCESFSPKLELVNFVFVKK